MRNLAPPLLKEPETVGGVMEGRPDQMPRRNNPKSSAEQGERPWEDVPR